jgi:hypothetical protein
VLILNEKLQKSPEGSYSGPEHLAIVFQSAIVSDETVIKVLLLGRELVV